MAEEATPWVCRGINNTKQVPSLSFCYFSERRNNIIILNNLDSEKMPLSLEDAQRLSGSRCQLCCVPPWAQASPAGPGLRRSTQSPCEVCDRFPTRLQDPRPLSVSCVPLTR